MKNEDLDFTAEQNLENLTLYKTIIVYLSYEKLLLKPNARKCKKNVFTRHSLNMHLLLIGLLKLPSVLICLIRLIAITSVYRLSHSNE